MKPEILTSLAFLHFGRKSRWWSFVESRKKGSKSDEITVSGLDLVFDLEALEPVVASQKGVQSHDLKINDKDQRSNKILGKITLSLLLILRKTCMCALKFASGVLLFKRIFLHGV